MRNLISERTRSKSRTSSHHDVKQGLQALVFTMLFVFTSAFAPMVWGQEIEWVRQFGSVDPADDMVQTVDADGNIYVAGHTNGTLPDQTSSGEYDAFVRKYDADGNELWTKQFGTSSDDRALGISSDASGVYVAGRSTGNFPDQPNSGGTDAFVRKYSVDGNERWTKVFGTSDWDQANSISSDGSGVYVAGRTGGTLPGQPTNLGGSDAFVRKYDAVGAVLWTRQFGTTSYDQANSISSDASGVYVAGDTDGALPGQTSSGFDDAFVRAYEDIDGDGRLDLVVHIETKALALELSDIDTEAVLEGQISDGSYIRGVDTVYIVP